MTTVAILVVGGIVCVLLKRIDNAMQDIRHDLRRKIDVQTVIKADSK